MLWSLGHSIPEVPWNDQWSMLEEIDQRDQGKLGWSYLWTPYWGHRLFLPCLLFLLSAKAFHYANGPLVAVNQIAQFAVIGFFALDWRILPVVEVDAAQPWPVAVQWFKERISPT